MSSSGLLSSFRQLASRSISKPSSLLEILQYGLLVWLCLQMLYHFGGFTALGTPLLGCLVSFCLLSIVHLLWMIFGGQRRAVGWEILLPLPALVLGYGWSELGPSTVEGTSQLMAWLIAYGVYVILCNSLHSRRLLWLVYFLFMGVAVFALLGAFFQYYLFPEWMVTLERERPQTYLTGASGFLLEPANLAALLILFFPSLGLILFMPRFSGPVRMLSGFLLAAFLLGLILSGTLATALAILLFLLLLPFFASRRRKFRLRYLGYAALTGLVLLPLVRFGTTDLRDRFGEIARSGSDPVTTASVCAGWSLAESNLLTGVGLGRFSAYYDSVSGQEIGGRSLYSANSYAGLLSELGLLGLLLVGGPILFIWIRLLLLWFRTPYISVSKDVRSRMERMGRGHPGRDSLERQHGRAPTAKVLSGALLLGFAGLAIHLWGADSLYLPIIHVFVGTFLALAVCLLIRRKEGMRWLEMASSALPAVIAGWVSMGAPMLLSQSIVYTTDEKLEQILIDPDRIFMNPTILDSFINDYEDALDLYPEHAGASASLGRSHMGRLAAEMDPPQSVAAEAVPHLENALALEPRIWQARFDLARAKLILGETAEAIEQLRKVRAHAPAAVSPSALLGILLKLDRNTVGEGETLIAEVQALNPEYEPLQTALRRQQMTTFASQGARQADQQFWASLFAQNPPLPERVLWAGIAVSPE